VDRRRAAGACARRWADSWEPVGWTSDFATAMPVGMALASTWDTDFPQTAPGDIRLTGSVEVAQAALLK
jgi:hypothetical protein